MPKAVLFVSLTGSLLYSLQVAAITTTAFFIGIHPRYRHDWKFNNCRSINSKSLILRSESSNRSISRRGTCINENDENGRNIEDDRDGNGRYNYDSQRRLLIRSAGPLSMILGGTSAKGATAAFATTVNTGATTTVGTVKQSPIVPSPSNNDRELSWPLGKVAFSLLPLAGTSTRRVTIEEEIVKNNMWTHDQLQGIVNVNVPVRQTVIKLNHGGGGLWVHNPVAPTPQLLQMMQRLINLYGPVRHIVLGTVALEHKATFAAFASYFPQATVWIQPGQWAFPINVPIEYYGLIQRGARLQELPIRSPASKPAVDGRFLANQQQQRRQSAKAFRYRYDSERNPAVVEWLNEIDYETLGPFQFKAVGGFSETAFYHIATQTLIVTDCVVSVTKDPPPIINDDPRALLFHSRDSSYEVILEDTIERRRKGWRHMVQFGLIFFPSQITVASSVSQVLEDIQHVPPNVRNLGDGAIPFNSALYPWEWTSNDTDAINFDYISQHGTLFCPPILTKLILDREPTATLEFVDRICQRFPKMRRIIPCHLNNNVKVRGTNEFYHAFDMLRSTSTTIVPQRALPEDLALLQKASDLLTQYNIIAPSLICDGEPGRQIGRFAILER